MRVRIPALVACGVRSPQLRYRLRCVMVTTDAALIIACASRLAHADGQTGFMDATKDYIAGLAAGVATVLIGHPFDTVKVLAPKLKIFFDISYCRQK